MGGFSEWHRSRGLLPACLVAGLLGAAVLAGCGGAAPSASPSPDPGVVAVVDGVRIGRDAVEAIRGEARLQGRSDAAGAARDEAVRRVLVRREAGRLGVRVQDGAIARRIAQLEADAGGADALDAALDRAALSREQLQQAIGYGLLAEALATEKGLGAGASVRAARSFYERHREDLFTTGASYRLGKITVPSERLAKTLDRRLRGGADFAATARRFSMDPQTRYDGGLLGWVMAVTLPAEALAVIERTPAGGVADPVFSTGKWQVFKVFGRRPSRIVPFSQVRSAITAELTRRSRMAALERWLDGEVRRTDVTLVP